MALTAFVWIALSVIVAARIFRAYDVAASSGRYRVTPLVKVYRYTASAPPSWVQQDPPTLRPMNRAQERKADAIARREARRGRRVVVERRR